MISSFEYYGHTVHLYCYEDIDINATKIDANSILPVETAIKKQFPGTTLSFSAFSNMFRYKLLLEKGGYWVDADTICLKPYDFIGDVFSSEDSRNRPNTGVIRTYDKTFIEDLYNTSYSMFHTEGLDGLTGPTLLNQKLIQYNKTYLVQPSSTFCSVDYCKFTDLINPDIELQVSGYSVHLWHEMFNRNNISINTFPENSFLWKAVNKYLA